MVLHNESYTDRKGMRYQIEYQVIPSDKGKFGTVEVCRYEITPDRGDAFLYALFFSDIALSTPAFIRLYGDSLEGISCKPGLDIIKEKIELQVKRRKFNRLSVNWYDISPFYTVDPPEPLAPKPLTEKELQALAEYSTLIPFQRKENDE